MNILFEEFIVFSFGARSSAWYDRFRLTVFGFFFSYRRVHLKPGTMFNRWENPLDYRIGNYTVFDVKDKLLSHNIHDLDNYYFCPVYIYGSFQDVSPLKKKMSVYSRYICLMYLWMET